MGKNLKFLITIAILAIIGALLWWTTKQELSKPVPPPPDAVVEEPVAECAKPYFSTFDVVKAQSSMKLEQSYLDAFISMPLDVLSNVCKVLLAQNDSVCITQIVDEYIENRDIYNALDDTPPPEVEDSIDSIIKAIFPDSTNNIKKQ